MAIYLDNAATTRLDPEAEKAMLSFQESHFANGSSSYRLGLEVAKHIEKARIVIAKKLMLTLKKYFLLQAVRNLIILQLKALHLEIIAVKEII